MSTTLMGIDADLHEANSLLADTQARVISAYEHGDVTLALQLEKELEAITEKRDDMASTKMYIVKKERQRGESEGRLSSVLYLSQMSDTFTMAQLPDLVFRSNARNEVAGITGVLYVLRGWFASYVEGTEASIDKLLRKLRADARHTRFRIIKRVVEAANATRKFPDNGLALRHIETPQSVSQQNPEATMLFELSTHLKLQAYVPQLDNVLRGRLFASNFGQVVPLKRFLVHMRPFLTFWSVVSDPLSRVAAIERVMHVAKGVVELDNNSQIQGAMVGPHRCDGALFVFQTEVASEVVRKVNQLFLEITAAAPAPVDPSSEEAIRAEQLYMIKKASGVLLPSEERKPIPTDPESQLIAAYSPVFSIHFGEVESVMDGNVSIVGPPVKVARLLADFAAQQGVPIALSEEFADELRRRDCEVVATTELLPRRPVDVFVPDQTKKRNYISEGALRLKIAKDAENEQKRDPIDELDHPSKGRFRAVKKQHVLPTTDDANAKPVKGLTSTEEARRIFNTLGCDAATDTILRTSFDGWYQSQDSMGVPYFTNEIDDVLHQFGAAGESQLTFDQFCMILYGRSK